MNIEDLKNKYGPHSCGIYDIRNVDGDIEWLIMENERLRKEKEWLIELLYNKVCETPIPLNAYRNTIEGMMQQALKEKVRRYDNKGAPID